MFSDGSKNFRLSGCQLGFSNRGDGSMNRHLEIERRRAYFNSLGIKRDSLVTADLINGGQVRLVTKKQGGEMIVDTDALVTAEPGLFLSATAADCFLVYFFDPVSRAAGIAHAGWRGTLAGIVSRTVKLMADSCASSPERILALISPGIRACHFEVSSSDRDLYADYSEAIEKRSDEIYVNLPLILKRQLLVSGLAEKNIFDSNECTYCLADKYFSFRREKSEPLKVMAGYIGY